MKIIKNLFFKNCHILVMVFLLLGVVSCASTQQERLDKIDSIGKSMTGRVSKFLGNKSDDTTDDWRSKRFERAKTARNKQNPRSPLIHKFIYDASDADKFVFFYRGKDKSSIEFGKVLKKYADEIDMRVVAYTLDNRSLSEFPNSVLVTRKIIEEYFGSDIADIKTPTLFLAQFDSYSITITKSNIPYIGLVNRMNKASQERIALNPKKYGY